MNTYIKKFNWKFVLGILGFIVAIMIVSLGTDNIVRIHRNEPTITATQFFNLGSQANTNYGFRGNSKQVANQANQNAVNAGQKNQRVQVVKRMNEINHSHNLKLISYNPANNKLTIQFKNKPTQKQDLYAQKLRHEVYQVKD